MRRAMISILMVLAMLLSATAVAVAAPSADGGAPPAGPEEGGRSDDLPHPLGQQQKALREQALEAVLHGKAHGRTHEVARGQFVELERTGEDSIWTVLADFGDEEHPGFTGGLPGPQHNQIAQPDRNYDNTTIWTADFNRDHYLDLLFSEAPGAVSMRNYYIEQSSNRYTVNGDVTDWAQVQYNTARYGRSFAST